MPNFSATPIDRWIERLGSCDAEQRYHAVDAIRHLCVRRRSIPLLLNALTDEYWKVRALSLHAIEGMLHDYRINDDNIVPSELALIESRMSDFANLLINDGDARVRLNAANILCLLGTSAESTVPELIRALDDHASDSSNIADEAKIVSIEAASALAAIGASAQDALPALSAMVEHANPRIAAAARNAIEQIKFAK